jgi:DNA-binding MarR family transcriptional regulator
MSAAGGAGDPSWRYSNVGRHFHNAARKFDARVLAILGERGWDEVRLVHINLTRCLDYSGTRLTELAKRAAMTKQAMGELVDECERMGLVERTADPTDGRAKIVVFTAPGKRFMGAFRDAIEETEAEITRQLGAPQVREMKQALADYTEGARARAAARRAPRPPAK